MGLTISTNVMYTLLNITNEFETWMTISLMSIYEQ